MAFTVDQFRSEMEFDGARTNLFKVIMPLPSFAGSSRESDKISFMCSAAQLPPSTLGTAGVFYFGRETKQAGTRATFADWSINIINDEDFVVRNVFEKWYEGLNSTVENLRNPFAMSLNGGYGVDALIIQYATTGHIIKIYKFVGMVPFDMAPIDQSWGTNDSIQDFTVTLGYEYWVSIPVPPDLPAPKTLPGTLSLQEIPAPQIEEFWFSYFS